MTKKQRIERYGINEEIKVQKLTRKQPAVIAPFIVLKESTTKGYVKKK